MSDKCPKGPILIVIDRMTEMAMKVIQGIAIAMSLSRVCAVAQYAVLEANGKVNGIGEISDPSQTLGLIWMPLQIYHYVPPGSRCAKFD